MSEGFATGRNATSRNRSRQLRQPRSKRFQSWLQERTVEVASSDAGVFTIESWFASLERTLAAPELKQDRQRRMVVRSALGQREKLERFLVLKIETDLQKQMLVCTAQVMSNCFRVLLRAMHCRRWWNVLPYLVCTKMRSLELSGLVALSCLEGLHQILVILPCSTSYCRKSCRVTTVRVFGFGCR